ncbi:hypothetical protein RY60_05065 [[Haemophilus] ducreyi]|uniref:Autotransporter domain-containing protein n=1 Tax=Haemophilus ducreyi TaxID=730 RepID=A0AAC9ENC0_HAEDC|nr:hypothetical protein RY60_05065 [[Haemophilus] ducreyi]AKO33072.1 hypothetical protein RZ57_05100 [[Haemophilus] ducreyi]AKO34521.1 hypothetical protein RZ58_05115 [[Haemophilus] ducreyi]
MIWRDKFRKYDPNDPNNKNAIENKLNGEGVLVGVLDSGFNNPFMGDDIRTKFGGHAAIMKTGRVTFTGTHGISVSEMIAGNKDRHNNGVAPRTRLLLADISIGNASGVSPSLDIYNALWHNGARIFNQSFGVTKMVTGFSKDLFIDNTRFFKKTNANYYAHQFNHGLLDFYRDKVKQDGLFIWAAGNERNDPNPSLEPGLPHFEPDLKKGWISVVAVAARHQNGLGNFNWNNLKPYSQAGVAKDWSITAVGDYRFDIHDLETARKVTMIQSGSSFSAPAVTGTAALVKQKYPWMTNEQIKMTILSTATDIGAEGVDDVFGWGLLDVEKATKGPARFDKRLTDEKDVVLNVDNNNANYYGYNYNPYQFENDISGDVGLVKKGNGHLILSGNSTFTGKTELQQGSLAIYGKHYYSPMVIKENSSLYTRDTDFRHAIENHGYYYNNGRTSVNNYRATPMAKLITSNDAKLVVNGEADLNGSKVALYSKEYVTNNGVLSMPLVAQAIKGVPIIEPHGMYSVVGNLEDNALHVELKRENVLSYLKSNVKFVDVMRENAAEAMEKTMVAIDNQLPTYRSLLSAPITKVLAELQQGKLNDKNEESTFDKLSGQIYASAQALTFQNAEAVNKDLSNRLDTLGTSADPTLASGAWASAIYANGKLTQPGFGEGKTQTLAGQVGADTMAADDVIVGAAMNYSKANVTFNRYGGNSQAKGVGVSLYSRLNNIYSTPVYLQGRLGFGSVNSDVERELVQETQQQKRKVNHRDKVISAYIESGYNLKQNDFTVTPFMGIAYDNVIRGAFTETNSQLGLTAPKQAYAQTSGLVGLRVARQLRYANGMKTTLQGYVNHQVAFNRQDLSYTAKYTGANNVLNHADFKVKGIGLVKNKTWLGIGSTTEITPNTTWYVNYDLKLENTKGYNNVVSTGIRVKF